MNVFTQARARAQAATFQGNALLLADLQACIDAESQIVKEQAKITPLLQRADNDTERAAREYQIGLIDKQLRRSADVARWRLARYKALVTDQDWQEEKARCKAETVTVADPWNVEQKVSGSVYWFMQWAWSYDPRAILKTTPFYPFDFQERAINRFNEAVFIRRESLLVDKSRDMGVTWLIADWDVYHWSFTPGFAALLGNRTEDEVDDSKGDMGATFNKIRFQMKRLPEQLLPANFNLNKDMPFMNLSNPENNANLAGGAPVEDFGRGDRRTVIEPDEFASWAQSKGYKQYTAMSQTTYSLLITSTVKGKFNKYGELLQDPNMPKLVLDWRMHPWKDERWYASLPYGYISPPMSATDIAQEVDRDPEASQPGQVLPMWDEVHHVKTLSEFLRVYGNPNSCNIARDGQGRIVMPPRQWNVSVGQDVGTTPDHPNVTGWMTRPMELDPYPKFIFTFMCLVRVGRSTRQIAEGVKDESGRVIEPGIMQMERGRGLTPDRITRRIISHEANSERLSYIKDCPDYPLRWSKWPGDANGGIDQIQNALEVKPSPDPFTIDPRTCDPQGKWMPYVAAHYCGLCNSYHEGEHLAGCSTHFFVVPDEEARLLVDDFSGKLYRSQAKTDEGFKLARYEIPGWHYPESEKGKPVKARKPQKGEDDFCDQWRMQMAGWALRSSEATEQQKVDLLIPAQYKPEALAALPDEQRAVADMGRYFAINAAKKKIREANPQSQGIYEDVKYPRDSEWI